MPAPLLLALAVAAAPAAVAPAAPAVRHPLTIDDLLAFERVGDPDLSPDGRLVAFTVARAAPDGGGLRSSLWVVATAGGAPQLQVLPLDGREAAALAVKIPGGVGEYHWVLKPRNTRVFYEEVFGWIERHLAAPNASPKPAPTTP